MGGVDLSDMLIALYRTPLKTRRWYMGIFAHMLDICVNNAWLLYRRHCAQKKLKKTLSLKRFRIEIFVSLSAKRTVPTDMPGPAENKIIKKPVVPRPIDDLRYDGIGHLPSITDKGRCRMCKSGYSTMICIKCSTRLCIKRERNCFYEFHVKN